MTWKVTLKFRFLVVKERDSREYLNVNWLITVLRKKLIFKNIVVGKPVGFLTEYTYGRMSTGTYIFIKTVTYGTWSLYEKLSSLFQ